MNEAKRAYSCRVCLGHVKKKAMLLSEEFMDMPIASHINSIVNLHISEDDGLPNKICPQCLAELAAAVTFKRKCESTNKILQDTQLAQPQTVNTGNNTELLIEIDQIKNEPDDTEFPSDTEFFEKPNIVVDVPTSITIKPDTKIDGNKPRKARKMIKSKSKKIKTSKKSKHKTKLKAGSFEQYQCDVCKEFFPSKLKIRVHLRNTHLPENPICSSCKLRFRTYRAYRHHLKRKPKVCVKAKLFMIEGEGKNRTIFCKQCSYSSKSMGMMMAHNTKHTGERPHTCEHCGKSFAQKSTLVAHKEIIHKEYKLESACQYCGKFIRGLNKMYQHLQCHYEKKLLQCSICSKMVKTEKYLKFHMMRHTGERTVLCDHCPRKFFSKSECTAHTRYAHLGGKAKRKEKTKCALCNYRHVSSSVVLTHQTRHKDGNVCCIKCGKFYQSMQALMIHEQGMHPCPHCDMKFCKSRKRDLQKHMRRRHKATSSAKIKEETQERNLEQLQVQT